MTIELNFNEVAIVKLLCKSYWEGLVGYPAPSLFVIDDIKTKFNKSISI